MPAQIDDTNYDIWLEHSSAKVGYRLARDENGNVMLSTGSAPFTAQQIYTGKFSLESVNANVTVPMSFEDWSGGAGFLDADLSDPNGSKIYYYSGNIDTSWPNRLMIGPEVQTGGSTTEAPVKFLYSSLGLFCMTTRYVLEWTGAAWTQRLDAGSTIALTDIVEYKNSLGTYIVVGADGAFYYISSDGINFAASETWGTAPAFRASNIASGTGTSAAVTQPAGTANNDILVAIVAVDADQLVTPPFGWTPLNATTIPGEAARGSFFWRRATASESATYTFTWTSSVEYSAIVAAYSGAITTGSPFDNTAFGTNASGTSHAAPTTTSYGGNRRVIFAAALSDVGAANTTSTNGTGYTTRSHPTLNPTHQLYDTTQASAGSVATVSSTTSTSVSSVVGHLVMIPAVTGAFDVARFAVRGSASGEPLLWAVTSTGDIRNTGDPTNPSAWSAADATQFGETGLTISGLEIVDNVFYLFTNKGITSYDGTTVATVWNNTGLTLDSGSARPFTWVDKAIYFTYSGSLFRYTADSLVVEKVWPKGDQIGNNFNNGIITAITGNSSNLWMVLKNADTTYQLIKCDPYKLFAYNGNDIMPIHPIKNIAAASALLIVPGASDTLHTTNPHIVIGSTTNAHYYILPRYNLTPQDDSNYRFSTSDGQIYGPWVSGGARTFTKFLNNVASLGESQSATLLSKIYYEIDNGSTTLAHNVSTNSITSTDISTDKEFSKLRYYFELETTVNTASPRLLGTVFNTSLNPTRKRQWELHIEIAEDTEMLGGGESRHGARYLDTHLFSGLNERVTFYDRLGNSFITKILDISSVVAGEDKDIYKVTLVQLV